MGTFSKYSRAVADLDGIGLSIGYRLIRVGLPTVTEIITLYRPHQNRKRLLADVLILFTVHGIPLRNCNIHFLRMGLNHAVDLQLPLAQPAHAGHIADEIEQENLGQLLDAEGGNAAGHDDVGVQQGPGLPDVEQIGQQDGEQDVQGANANGDGEIDFQRQAGLRKMLALAVFEQWYFLQMPIEILHGTGPVFAARFAVFGITTVVHLLHYFIWECGACVPLFVVRVSEMIDVLDFHKDHIIECGEALLTIVQTLLVTRLLTAAIMIIGLHGVHPQDG